MKKLLLLTLFVACGPALEIGSEEQALVTLRQPEWFDNPADLGDMFFQQTTYRPDGVPAGNRTLHARYVGTEFLYDPHATSTEVERSIDGGPWTSVRTLSALGVFGGITEAWNQWVPIRYRIKILGDAWTGGQIVYSEPFLTYTIDQPSSASLFGVVCRPTGNSNFPYELQHKVHSLIHAPAGATALPFTVEMEIRAREADGTEAWLGQLGGLSPGPAFPFRDWWGLWVMFVPLTHLHGHYVSFRHYRWEGSDEGAAASLFTAEVFQADFPGSCK
jgi:hypothetical protein